MHGEYKTPGGKLVVVDFQVEDGALSEVMVSGDFFLYPEDALSDLTGGVGRRLGRTDGERDRGEGAVRVAPGGATAGIVAGGNRDRRAARIGPQ